jgi:hypothetical protein
VNKLKNAAKLRIDEFLPVKRPAPRKITVCGRFRKDANGLLT